MLIEINDTDLNPPGEYITGIVVASDGEIVAEWSYYSCDDSTEIWFEDVDESGSDFIRNCTDRQIAFLEARILEAVAIFIKEESEFESICEEGASI